MRIKVDGVESNGQREMTEEAEQWTTDLSYPRLGAMRERRKIQGGKREEPDGTTDPDSRPGDCKLSLFQDSAEKSDKLSVLGLASFVPRGARDVTTRDYFGEDTSS